MSRGGSACLAYTKPWVSLVVHAMPIILTLGRERKRIKKSRSLSATQATKKLCFKQQKEKTKSVRWLSEVRAVAMKSSDLSSILPGRGA